MFDIKYEELKKANTKSPLRFYWDCAKGFRWVLVGDIVYSFLNSLLKVLSIVIFARLIEYFSSVSMDEFKLSRALNQVYLVLATFCATHIVRFVRETMSEKARSMLSWRARIFAFDYVSKYPLSYIKEQKSGVIAQRIKALGDNIWGLKLSFARISSCIFLIFIPLIFIGNKNTCFLFIVLCLGIVSALFSFVVSKKTSSLSKRTEEKNSNYNGYVADSLTNILLIKMFGEEKSEVKKLEQKLKLLKIFEIKSIFSENFIYAIQGGLLAVFRITAVIFALYLWKENKLTVADVISLLLLIDNVIPMFSRFMNDITLLRNDLARFSDSFTILTVPLDVKNEGKEKKLKVKKGEIEFKDICFSYNKNKKIFDNFNLKIKAGEKIGIVGKSGCGKSTLISLLQRNFDLCSGKILIDGKDISKSTIGSLKQNIAVITQDNILFHRTIEKNIKYGKPNASKKEVIKAAKQAIADDFIKEMPYNYGTITGERGVKLSGGQRQRIAIARAILKDAPILIFDESTSSLDNNTEKEVISSLIKLMKDKTIIFISHRLSSLCFVDRIIALDRYSNKSKKNKV